MFTRIVNNGRTHLISGGLRFNSTLVPTRPKLQTLLPSKKILNRILFDNDSRLSYKKMMPVLENIYNNIDRPVDIKLPRYIKGSDLMSFKNVLSTIRNTTNSINRNLVDLENELVEQAAEFGDNDAITILAFESVENPSTSKEDYNYANDLIKKLTDLKHPLVFKMAGDLAFKREYYEQAKEYWLDFINLEPNTILASQVYSNLGIYYFNYLKPRPNLQKAKFYFEKSIKFGELDKFTIKSHYYLGQLYSITNPQLSKYHLEISASKGLTESFPSLGFLEMNVFQNYHKSIEWFKLGIESNNDISCMIGQFDCLLKVKDFKNAFKSLNKMTSINEQISKVRGKPNIPKEREELINTNQALLNIFFSTRRNEIKMLSGKFI